MVIYIFESTNKLFSSLCLRHLFHVIPTIGLLPSTKKFIYCVFFILFHCNQGFSLQEEVCAVEDSVAFLELVEAYLNQDNLNLRLDNARKILDRTSHCDLRWQIQGHYHYGTTLMHTMDGDNLTKSVDLLQKALAMSRQIGDSSYTSKVLLPLAQACMYNHDLEKGMNYTYELENLAKYLKDEILLAQNFSLRAKLYQRLNLFRKALKEYDTSKRIRTQNDYEGQGFISFNQALIYHENLQDYERAYFLYKQAQDNFANKQDYYSLAAANVGLGKLFLDQNEYKKAKTYLNECLRLSKVYEILFRQQEVTQLLAEMYMHQGMFDSAFHYIEKAIDLTDSLRDLPEKIEALKIRNAIFKAQGDYHIAIQYDHLLMVLEDSLKARNDVVGTTELLLNREIQKREEDAKTLQHILKRKKLWFGAMVGILIVLFIVAFFMLRKYKAIQSLTKNKEAALIQTLNKEKDKIDYLNRELVSASASLAVKNGALNEAKNALQKADNYLSNKNVLKEAREAKKSISDALHMDKMWDTFFMHFNEVYPGFYEALQSHYKLSNTEIKICAFIKMNLTNKEICQIINLSPKSIPTTLYRLKNKLKLPQDSNVRDFIHSHSLGASDNLKKK